MGDMSKNWTIQDADALDIKIRTLFNDHNEFIANFKIDNESNNKINKYYNTISHSDLDEVHKVVNEILKFIDEHLNKQKHISKMILNG